MTAHSDHPRAAGKYDCSTDEYVHTVLMFDGGDDAFGDVTDYAIHISRFDLDIECEGHEHDPSVPSSVAGVELTCDGSCRGEEWDAAQHYGSPWLLIREDAQGFVYIAGYETVESRDAVYGNLEREYEAWAEAWADGRES